MGYYTKFPVLLSYRPPVSGGWVSSNSTDAAQTTYTYTSQNIGTAGATRLVVVGVHATSTAAGTGSVSSVTIAGITATQLYTQNSTGNTLKQYFYGAYVPTGTTGNIVVTMVSAPTSGRLGIDVFALYDVQSITPISTGFANANTTNPQGFTLSVTAGSVVCAISGTGQNNSPSNTWTGLTETSDRVIGGGNCMTSATSLFAAANASLSVSVTQSVATTLNVRIGIVLR